MMRSFEQRTLEQFLLSDAVPQGSMGLYDLNGFLTGLAAGPEAIPYEEWSPILWGAENPCFRNRMQERLIVDLLIKRYGEIAEALTDVSIDSEAFYNDDCNDRNVMASAWADGFLQAMELRPKTWLPLIRHRSASIYLMPLLTLYGDLGEQYDLPLSQELRHVIVSAAINQIPTCAREIRKFWDERADVDASNLHISACSQFVVRNRH